MSMKRQMYQFILYDLENVQNIVECLNSKNVNGLLTYSNFKYAFCKHDKDLDSNGNLKKVHYHLVVKFEKQIPCEDLLFNIGEFLPENDMRFIQSANGGAWAYLIHANDLRKFPYQFDEIYSNIDRETLYDLVESHRKCPAEKVMSSKAKDLVLLLDNHTEIDTFRKLVTYLVYDEPNDMLLGWCAKNTYFVNTMLGGNLKKNKGDRND